MKYKIIIPEIMISLGDESKLTKINNREEVVYLHMNLENWYGDDILINNYDNCIVTEGLKSKIENSVFTGFSFSDMLVTKDIYFDDNYQLNKPLPKFFWMKIRGRKNTDDLFIENFDLYASERFITYLTNNFSVKNLQIDPQENEFDDFIKDLIEKDKNAQYTFFSLADQEHLKGDTPKAIQILKNAFDNLSAPKENFGETSDILLKIVDYQTESKDFEAAFKTLDRLEPYLNADDSDAILLYRAKVHYLAGDTDKAFYEFQSFKLSRGMHELRLKYPEYNAIFQKLL